MFSDTSYVRCNKTGWVQVYVLGDDKTWCGKCRRAHAISETSPATEQDMEAQRASLPSLAHFKTGH